MLKADDRGHFNIKIQMDGTWIHEGDPIKRDKLVKLFASVLHRDEDGQHWLVTPVEKGRIDVEVAPLFITGINIENQGEPDTQSIHVSTSTGDACILGAENPLSMTPAPDGELLPTVVIRDGLAGYSIARPIMIDGSHYRGTSTESSFRYLEPGRFL